MNLKQIIEATLITEWRQRLGQLPGGEFYDGTDLQWSLTGASHKNAVFGARLAPQDVPIRVQQVHAYFAQRSIEYFAWVIGPSTQPADLGDQLVAHYGAHALDGWRSVALAGMVLDLAHLPESIPSPPDVTVEHIPATGAVDEWASVTESHPVRRQLMHDLLVSDSLRPQPTLYAYLARRQGTPLGAVLVFDCAKATCLRALDVLPEARRQGVGAWLCWHALREARQRGHQLAVTDATDMGHGVYQRVGFRDCCTIFEYACPVPAI